MKKSKSSPSIFLMVYSLFFIGYAVKGYLPDTMWVILVPVILSAFGWSIWTLYVRFMKYRLNPMKYQNGIAVFFGILILAALFLVKRESLGNAVLLLMMLMGYSISAFRYFIDHSFNKDETNASTKE
jgi:hypothetical protein